MDAIPQRYYRRLSDRAVKGAIAPLRGCALDCTTFRLFAILILAGLGFLVFARHAILASGSKKPCINLWGFFFCAYLK